MSDAPSIEGTAYALYLADLAFDYDIVLQDLLKHEDMPKIRKSWGEMVEAQIHDGDCTNQIHMCILCQKEGYFRQAAEILAENKIFFG